jgi:hypothetical protein
MRLIESADRGMNLAIMNADGISAQFAEFTIFQAINAVKRIKQWTIEDDQLVYPSPFWNSTGVCGAIDAETTQRSTKRIHKVLICLMLQLRNHFICALETLREEFIRSVSGHLVNVAKNWLWAAQRSHLAREDGIRGVDGAEDGQKEFGLKSFIPSSPTYADQCWHSVAEKCFALSTEMGPPTFFLTLTMNPHSAYYQGLK